MAEEIPLQTLRTREGLPYLLEDKKAYLGQPEVKPPADLKELPPSPFVPPTEPPSPAPMAPQVVPPEQKSGFEWWRPPAAPLSPEREPEPAEEERATPTFRERQRAYLESLRAAEEGEAPQVSPPEREFISGKEGPSWEETVFGETPPAELFTNPDKYTVSEDSSIVDKETGQVVYRPIPGSPFDIAAQRQKEAAMPREGRSEGWLTEHPDLGVVIPRSPLDVAMLALPAPLKPLVKTGILAAGAALESEEAKAGISGNLRKLSSKLTGGLPPPPTAAPPPMAPVPKPPRKIIRGVSEQEPTSFEKIYTRTVDDLHPLKILQNKLNANVPITPDEQFYTLARLTRGSFGRSHQALNNATFDFKTLANNGKGLKQILRPVSKQLDEFEDYAVAMRDLELNARGVQTGANIADAQAKVAQASPEFRKALADLHAYQRRVLEYLRDSGVISDESFNNMVQANKHYVPFHRLMDSNKSFGASGRNIKAWNPIRGIQGSGRDILSPIETIIKNTHAFIDLAEKNRALTALTDAANMRNLPGLVERVPTSMHPVNVTRDEVEKFLNGAGVKAPGTFYGAPDQFTIFRPNAFRPANDEIAVFRNGKREVYRVDPEVANAVNGMGSQEVSMVMRLASLPAKTLRAGATLSPEFLIKNPLRDQFSAAVLSQNGYIPVFDYFRGLGHLVFNTKTYQNWLKSGGANASLVSMDRRYIRDEIKNLTQSGALSAVKNVLNPLELLNNLAKISELGEKPTRIAEFARAAKKGKTAHEAGLAAREVTIDFSRRGADKFLQGISQSTAFLNPQVQGIDKLARSFKENPAATSFKIGAYIVAPTLLAYYFNRQDPRMQEVPRWERDLYWHFPVDDWQEWKETRPGSLKQDLASIPDMFKKTVDGKTYVNFGIPYRFPKPFEIGVLFGSGTERVLDAYFDKHPEAFKEFGKSLRSAFFPSVIPTIVAPILESTANYSFFRDAPIVPKRVQSPEHRKFEYTPQTTESAKYMAGLIDKLTPDSQFASPMIIENYIRGWTGTLGNYALQGADKVIGAAGGKEKIAPEKTAADMPVMRAVISRMPRTDAASIKDFYENVEAARSNIALVKRLEKENEPESAESVRQGSVLMKMNKVATAMSRQFEMIRRIQEAKDIDPASKRRQIDLITLGMIQMAQHSNAEYARSKQALPKNRPLTPPTDLRSLTPPTDLKPLQ